MRRGFARFAWLHLGHVDWGSHRARVSSGGAPAQGPGSDRERRAGPSLKSQISSVCRQRRDLRARGSTRRASPEPRPKRPGSSKNCRGWSSTTLEPVLHGLGVHRQCGQLPGVLRAIYGRTGKAGRSSPSSATRLAQPNRTDRICSRACCSVRPITSAPVGAHNSVVGAGQGLRAPSWDLMCRILCRFRRVAGTAGGASRALEGPRDHRPTAPARRAAPPQQPTAAGRRGPGPAWCCRGGPAPTAASRLARHVGDLVALAPTPHRPHCSLDQRPPVATDPSDQPDGHLQIVKTARCGGLINEYRNAA